ncbi:MAG: TlpA family protein disulfide reductase [Bacteroidetes bacterium]|nr:TlpA family protein disulfide reductase [Bacteroidota bacterium]MBL6942760.1 TlpA family protein disulfide reductase [Bacteroidales bacterium]
MASFNLKASIKKYLAKKKWYSILSDAVFIILIVLLIIPSTRTEVASFFIQITSLPPSTLDSDEQFKINNQTKLWQIYDMEGRHVSFASLNDKPVFLNFWATWCPPCVAELPGIADLYKKYNKEVNFIIVSDENPDKVQAFVIKNNLDSLPFYQNKSVPSDFKSQSIPTTFIIDKEGVVVVIKKGAARWNSGRIQTVIDQLISKQNG